MRTIRVTGKGMIKVHPDMTRITITLRGLNRDYAAILEQSSKATEAIKDLLVPFGFARTDLKTLRFGVDTEHESYKEKGEYKQRFIGYSYAHTLKVEFESDNKLLGQILYALAHCSMNPEFRISYTVKDPETMKNELLGKAVQDAMAKASVLSGVAGLRLGDIQAVDYSWGEVDFEVRNTNALCCNENLACELSPSYDLDIEPDDIDVEDTVTVVWEIQ